MGTERLESTGQRIAGGIAYQVDMAIRSAGIKGARKVLNEIRLREKFGTGLAVDGYNLAVSELKDKIDYALKNINSIDGGQNE